MSIYFPRPQSIPTLPNAAVSDTSLVSVSEVSPEFMISLPKTTGGTFFSSRGKLHLMVTEPADVQEVLVAKSDDYLKGDEEIALSKAIGWGLIGLEGSVHKHAQKAARPALQVDALNTYVRTIKTVASKHIGALEAGSTVPMRNVLRCLSQEAAERSLFSSTEDVIDYSY